MAYKVTEIDVDGLSSTFVYEQFEDEVANAFLEADRDAGEEVDVIYMIDDRTGEDIELWRQDWMIQRLTK